MSQSTWACTTAETCTSPTWDHAQAQLAVGGIYWAVLTMLALFWSTCGRLTNIDMRARFSLYQYGLASASWGAAICCLVVYVLQSGVFWHRSLVGYVDPIYHAIEILGTMMSTLDMVLYWACVCSDGMSAVIVHCFGGPLIVDALVSSSTIALFYKPEGGKKTWFSFALLANFSAMRCLKVIAIIDVSKTTNGTRRQIMYSLMSCFLAILGFGSLILTLEILGPDSISNLKDQTLPGTVQPWSMTESLDWSVSVFMLLGNNARSASCTLSQIVTLVALAVATTHMITRMLPTALDLITKRYSYKGRYPVERRMGLGEGHTIVCGNPTVYTLWDFLVEYYHPNHFTSASHFDNEATDVVILHSEQSVLAHLERLLTLSEATGFQSRVFLFSGEAFSLVDHERVSSQRAKRVVVLPDMLTSDTETDDSTNIMRAYAFCSVDVKLQVTCLLHSAEHQSSMLSGSTANSTFVSIDAMKMGILGKACCFPGAAAFVCNLIRSVGEAPSGMDAYKRYWMRDYEKGLDMELYEVILNPGYHGCSFQEIFEDILFRSKGQQAYLIGLTDTGNLGSLRGKIGEREVLINPGPDYRVEVAAGNTAGVFIAPDMESIVQLRAGSELLSGRDKKPAAWIFKKFERQQSEVLSTKSEGKSTGKMSYMEKMQAEHAKAELARTGTTPTGDSKKGALGGEDDEEDNDEDAKKKVKRKMTREELKAKAEYTTKYEKFFVEADTNYEEVMGKVKKRMMTRGLDPESIAASTGTKPFERRFPRTFVKEEKKEEEDSDKSEEDLFKQNAAASGLMRETAIWAHIDKTKKELDRLNKLAARIAKDALGLHPPPESMLRNGGHVLLCVVGDTEVNSIAIGSQKQAGSVIGLNCFMKSLRDKRLELNQGSNPPVIVLSEVMPGDWNTVIDVEKVYYVRGSPLILADLHRVSFLNARSIVVVRQHNGTIGGIKKIVDARVILAAALITNAIPADKEIPVVTDHAFAGSCELLPKDSVFVENGPLSEVSRVSPPEKLPRAIQVLFANDQKVLAKSDSLTGRPSPFNTHNALDAGTTEEIYEELEVWDFKYHPRYLRGQVFHASAVSSMVANSLYNPTLVHMVDALVESPMMLIDVPKAAVGLYRSAEASKAAYTGDHLDRSAPTHFFVFTAPPGGTFVVTTDRVIVIGLGVKDQILGQGKKSPMRAFTRSLTRAMGGGKSSYGDED
eukprot:CAMPEP_0115059344 /NCGR_PEP_ID=MMETSP0227-20121206/6858_1 /TAXON_ID=89957 /ORGANISM="Polarella glacialis, Strain CCMP 1383" /LENGTH=1201 /DNA_ID=CAMNT_0002444441 /DNA_START=71 /DNA_END=3676 /DNA_ORIENTATION=-